jgi:hypothetical protein
MDSGSKEQRISGNLVFLSLAAASANFTASFDVFRNAMASKVSISPILSNSVSSIVLTLSVNSASLKLSEMSITKAVGL